jgi:hypothetical protein
LKNPEKYYNKYLLTLASPGQMKNVIILPPTPDTTTSAKIVLTESRSGT